MQKDLNLRQSTSDFFSSIRMSESEAAEAMDPHFKDALKQELASLHLHNISHEKNSQKDMGKSLGLFASRKGIFFAGSILFAALLGLGIGVTFLSKDGLDVNRSNTIAGNIAYIEGDVEYQKEDGGWYPAQADTDIKEGQALRTLGASKAIINLDDGSAIRLDANSEVSLDSLDAKDIVLTNAKGNVYTRVAEAEREFTVLVEGYEFTALGTAYQTVNGDAKKGVQVYQSKVKVDKDTANKATVDEGNQYYIEYKANVALKDKAYPIDVNKLKEDEFVKWNVEKDEESAEYQQKLGVLKDVSAPGITILDPDNGETTQNDKFTVLGKTEVGATVKVNGEAVTNNNGDFSKELSLQMGENKITVSAADKYGNTATKEIKLIREEKQVAAPAPPKTTTPTTGISLSGFADAGGIKVKWTVSNVSVTQGFKVVKATHSNPTYGQDSAEYVSDSGARSHYFSLKDGKEYYFRVCRYTGSGCDSYSNVVKVKAPSVESTSTVNVNSISLSSAGGTAVSWSVDGTASEGFKLVWAKTTSPVYPGNFASYYEAHKNTGDISWGSNDGPGLYYVRVCAYKSGTGCVKYSNQIEVTIP